MLLLSRVRLSSNLMGIRRTPVRGGCVRRFERLPDGRLKTPLPVWDWALRESFETFGWRDLVDWSSVRPDVAFQAERLDIYTRRWNKGAEKMHEDFEAVLEGQEVSLPIIVSQGPDAIGMRRSVKTRMPDLDELAAILSFIGRFLGISPWGNRYGYGRFELIDIKQIIFDACTLDLGRHGLDHGPVPPGIAEDPDDQGEGSGWEEDNTTVDGSGGVARPDGLHDIPGILEDGSGEVPRTGVDDRDLGQAPAIPQAQD